MSLLYNDTNRCKGTVIREIFIWQKIHIVYFHSEYFHTFSNLTKISIIIKKFIIEIIFIQLLVYENFPNYSILSKTVITLTHIISILHMSCTNTTSQSHNTHCTIHIRNMHNTGVILLLFYQNCIIF